MSNSVIIKVAVAAPLFSLFDYLPPDSASTAQLLPGCRVRVPFGRSKRIGIIWESCDHDDTAPPSHRLRAITEIIDATPLLDENERLFLSWCAGYYHHPIGEVVSAALPTRLRQSKQPCPTLEQGWRVAGKSISLHDFRNAPVQQRILQRLLDSTEGVSDKQLTTLDGDIRPALKRLQQKGAIERSNMAPVLTRPSSDKRVTLSQEQQKAVDAIHAANGFNTLLLDGITGSGKTEVYLHAADHAISRRLQVLVLVPEIALTPQLLRRFQRGIDGVVAVSHSALSSGNRERTWMQAQKGEADLLIGTRSAIFTPMPRLGLIIIDEEHDISFKQQEGFRYSARDLAVMKAKQRNIPIVLGSATPSLETLHNSLNERYQWLKLRQRAGKAKPPQIGLVDIRAQRLRAGICSDLIKSIREEIDKDHQVILFLNRRGYAPQLTCHACGWIAECNHCDARMTWHQKLQRLWCHHCGCQHAKPERCPDCGARESLIYQGQGTERVEEYLGEVFPDIPVIRIDRDSTRRKGSLEKALHQVNDSGACIMVGTQMLAKGHDFPRVTLVGILNADQGLLNPDFRSPERTAQLLVQVSGRAGRAEKPGKVLIQTRHPHNPLLKTLLHKGYEAFSREELAQRQHAQLPPFAHQALIRAEGTDSKQVQQFLQFAISRSPQLLPHIELWGPTPALIERKAGYYRWHLLLQTGNRQVLHQQLKEWLKWLRQQPQARRIRWSVDVDPVEIL
ncbi:MAG: primosomal protein N' [Gammaproteobacteria bacterium]|nr:primosomal protein N' [Gammaproteobacteria bacterium]